MTLAPLIDMINHTPTASENVTISRQDDALEIRASRTLHPGDEILFSYHSQTSRFWVCEYGFLLDENQYDDLDLSDEIEGVVQCKKELLERLNYWGWEPF